MTRRQWMSVMICAANESVMDALIRAGLPMAAAQRITMDRKRQKEQRERIAKKVTELEKGK